MSATIHSEFLLRLARTGVPPSDLKIVTGLYDALKELLEGYDEETGNIDLSASPFCQECTCGTTPSHLDRGPCKWHHALAALARARREPGAKPVEIVGYMPEEDEECANCHGTGVVDTPHSGSDPSCPDCDGTGRLE